MKMKQLEYLIKIVECGSISTAAKELYISQPSLTKAIISLEEEYGIQILIRKARGVDLTMDGRSFVHYARGVLTAARALESNFSSAPGVKSSRLFVAAQQLDFVHKLFLKTYIMNQEGNLHYNLVETDRNDVVRHVLDSNVDLGILVRSNTDAKNYLWHTEAKRLDIHVLDRSGIYVCVGQHSPLFHRKSVTFEECKQLPCVALDMEEAAAQNMYLDNETNYFNTDRIIFFNSIEACKMFLKETDSVLFIAQWVSGYFQEPEYRIIPVVPDKESQQHLNNELLWLKRKGEPLSPTEMQFLQHLYRHLGKEDLLSVVV